MTLAQYLRWYHDADMSDFTPIESPGYWQRKEPCGCRGKCSSVAYHGCWGFEGPTHHTIHYQDPDYRDARGRFLSPYRTWRAARETLSDSGRL